MDENEQQEATSQPVPANNACPDCGQSYKSPQGLAGHRRLAHSSSTAQALAERSQELDRQRRALESKTAEIARREAAAKRTEADLSRRQREIAETGPSSIGLAQCRDCGAWFDDTDVLRTHKRGAHPLDAGVAAEVGVGKERVNDVWTEACRKQDRHPDESPDQIVERFWSETDQKILRALLRHNAAFKFAEEE